jgi:hypothetical protein
MQNDKNTGLALGCMVGAFVACLACTTAQQGASGTTSASPSSGAGANSIDDGSGSEAQGHLPVDDVSAAGARFSGAAVGVDVADVVNQTLGAKVTVSGVFMGFSGACVSDAPSRSAWHLSASKAPKAPCVYVDGPFPAGLSPAVHAGTPTTVTATVSALGNTKYLVSTGE